MAPVSSFRRGVQVLEKTDAGRGLWCKDLLRASPIFDFRERLTRMEVVFEEEKKKRSVLS